METRQELIIKELGVKPEIDPAKEIQARQTFLEQYLGYAGVNGFVLGISGGQDSLLAGILAQRAVEARRAAGHNASFHAVLLPYGEQADRADALLALQTIQPDFTHDLDIQPGTDGLAESFATSEAKDLADYHKGNVKARMRMIAQYAIAGDNGLVVIGTDHAAEAVTGFFTKYGDGGADVLPLSGLSKRQGKQMLQELGVPDVFITKKPTADLLDGRPGQPDEDELAISYEIIDDYLEGKDVKPEDAEVIEARFIATVHKRSQPVAYEAVA
ncbi:TPA: NAD(+) synthase [Candidatus Saccharibacteria bacterium]|nr:NAD(+) synthase [Candidatus Saccharibacteria bacterium]HRK40698.1 ammonia-dependent NAD(+) synthetase [Candidatus Saccharibacteria bacterium]